MPSGPEEGTSGGEEDPPCPHVPAQTLAGAATAAADAPSGSTQPAREATGSLPHVPPNHEERRGPATAIPASRVAMPAASFGGGTA